MKTAAILLISLFLLLFASNSFASWNKPEFRLSELYRYDCRDEGHELFITRASVILNYANASGEQLFKIVPFFEARRNIKKSLWERKELGLEIGRDFLSWLYLGEAVQWCWTDEDYQRYRQYAKRKYAESETRLLLSHKLFSIGSRELKGFVLNEYTYDFNKGRGIRNELAGGFTLPIVKHLEMQINWRHIDRIHFYDSDVAEGAFTLVF